MPADSDVVRAVEEAVDALSRDDPGAARTAVAGLPPTDPAVGAISDAVVVAATELETEGEISPMVWNALADAVPPDLRPLVEWARG